MPAISSHSTIQPTSSSSLVRALGLILLLFGAFASPARALDSIAADASGSEFHRLALSLRQSSSTLKVDFARAAIAETLALYQREMAATNVADGSEKLQRWYRNVGQYADRLQATAASITPATAVGIHESEGGYIFLSLGGQPVIIGGPRPGQQPSLEQAISQHFCSQYPCDSLVPGFSGDQGRDIETLPHWEFSIEPVPTCSSGDGLALVFNRSTQMLKKRELCKQLFEELVLLADEMTLQQETGVSVDWHAFKLEGTPDSGRGIVTLNENGDAIELDIPACATSPALIRRILPWLKSRVAGEASGQVYLVVTHSEKLIGPLLEEPGSLSSIGTGTP